MAEQPSDGCVREAMGIVAQAQFNRVARNHDQSERIVRLFIALTISQR